MHFLILFCVCCLCNVCTLQSVEKIDIKPVGYLRSDIYAPMPVAPDASVRITSHLHNISPAPVRLAIDKYTYNPVAIYIKELAEGFDPAQVTDVWGPRSGKYIVAETTKLLISGVPESLMLRHLHWAERSGIVLFEGEGYARMVTFAEGWIERSKLPKKDDFLVFSFAISADVQLPVLKPDAVAPGKPVIFDKSNLVYAPSSRLLPFRRSAEKEAKDQAKPVADSLSPLSLSIEIHEPVEAGRDMTAVYLIGNIGNQTVWIMQNELVPARVDWTLSKSDRELAQFKGEDLADLEMLMPERKAIPLNPGEFLSWRRVMLAGELPVKSRRSYDLQASLKARYWLKDPQSEQEQQAVELELQSLFDLKVR